MSHVVPAFIFLGVAITVSLIVFVTELCFGRKEQGVGQRYKGRHTREAWVEGRGRKDLRGGREERGIVQREMEDKIEEVSDARGIEDRIEVVREGRGIEEKNVEREKDMRRDGEHLRRRNEEGR